MWGSTDEEFVRFLAGVKNPGAKTLSGTVLQWVASDASGVVVGSYKRPIPDIGAGATHVYAGGAGGANLSGLVSSVKVTITEPGKYVDRPAVALTVTDIKLTPKEASAFNFLKAPALNDVSAVVTSPSKPTARLQIGIVIVVRDSEGKIVGGTFASLDNAPDTLDPGTKVRLADETVESTAKGATADVYAYVQP